MEPQIAFGLCADTHYAKRVYGDRHCPDSLAKLRACVDTFNQRKLGLCFHLGDLIDGAEDKQGEIEFLAAAGEAYASFAGERFFVLGNHDLAAFTKAEFLARARASPQVPWHSFDRKGVHFIVLDGNCLGDGTDFASGNFDWAEAWVSSEQLVWLARDLNATPCRHVIVLCHENLDHRLWQGTLDPHVVRNAEAVRAILEPAGKVRAVIQGHYHPGMRRVFNGIPYFAPAAMVVGQGLPNNAYAIASVWPDGSISVEGFGRQESFRIAASGTSPM